MTKLCHRPFRKTVKRDNYWLENTIFRAIFIQFVPSEMRLTVRTSPTVCTRRCAEENNFETTMATGFCLPCGPSNGSMNKM